MANMFMKLSAKLKSVKVGYAALNPTAKAIFKTLLAFSIIAAPEIALAQSYGGGGGGSAFFCYIAQYFKQIVGTAALVAITMWAIEHIFGVSKIHDMVIKVGVSAAIVIGGSLLITNSGLTTSCVL